MATSGKRADCLCPLVIALTALGLLFHTRKRTHAAPTVCVSLPMAMWAAGMALWRLAGDAFMVRELKETDNMLLLSLMAYSYVVSSACFNMIVTFRSNRLAQLLERMCDLDANVAGFEGRQPRVLTHPVTALNLAMHVCLGGFMTEMFRVFDVLCLLQLVLMVSIIVTTTSLFRSSFTLLSWDLRRALATSRTALPNHEKESVVEGRLCVGLDLPRLQAACLMVEETKNRLLEYLGLPVAILILGDCVIMICILCSWIKFHVSPYLCFGIALSIASSLFVLCNAPQRLGQEASQVERELLLLRGPVDSDTHHQVCLILATLRRVSDMSVNGVYTLGNHIIVQMAGFITTYLVILLQLPSDVVDQGNFIRGYGVAAVTSTTTTITNTNTTTAGAANITF